MLALKFFKKFSLVLEFAVVNILFLNILKFRHFKNLFFAVYTVVFMPFDDSHDCVKLKKRKGVGFKQCSAVLNFKSNALLN